MQYVDKWAIECDDGITSITLRSDTVGIAGLALESNASLTSVNMPDSVICICYGAFWNCESLQSITIPYGVKTIDVWTFDDCSSLTSAIFENTEGWVASGIDISSADLADPSTAAKYLTKTYTDYTWSRSQ